MANILQRFISQPLCCRGKRQFMAYLQPVSHIASVFLLALALAAPALAQSRGAADSVMIFGGVASETNFTDLLISPVDCGTQRDWRCGRQLFPPLWHRE